MKDKINFTTINGDEVKWMWTPDELDKEYQAVLELIRKDTAWNRAIEEIKDWGAYIQETDGETDLLKGINFCLDIIKKHVYCD